MSLNIIFDTLVRDAIGQDLSRVSNERTPTEVIHDKKKSSEKILAIR